MALSTLPTGGPTIPPGAQKVSLKNIDVSSTTTKVDVTVLTDSERKYADPPLKDGGASAATATCSASGLLKGSPPQVTDTTVKSGWICEDTEVVYEVGKHATWSANWSFIPPTT